MIWVYEIARECPREQTIVHAISAGSSMAVILEFAFVASLSAKEPEILLGGGGGGRDVILLQ